MGKKINKNFWGKWKAIPSRSENGDRASCFSPVGFVA